MSKEEAVVLGWESVIKEFLDLKRDTEEEKYLKDILKDVVENCEKNNWFNNESIKSYVESMKSKKTDGVTLLASMKEKLFGFRDIENLVAEIDIKGLCDAYVAKSLDLSKKYSPMLWIDSASKNASSVSFATHVVKLTHSKIDTPSIFDSIDATSDLYVSTSSLKEKIVDGAVAGNQFAPIFQFLELEFNGIKLASELSRKETVALESFSKDAEQLSLWNKAFKAVSIPGDMAAHALLKQIYFPASSVSDHQYHLLCPVVSSSLAHLVYQTLFNDDNKLINSQYEKNKYCPYVRVRYPNRANISVTASNHSNASQLNGKRGGKLHLLAAQPPTWKKTLSPPIKRKSWFDYGIPYSAVKNNVDYIREFLLRFESADLSVRDPNRKKWLIEWVGSIVDDVLFYAGNIQSLPAGWTNDAAIKLKAEHQYFLDPYRDDEVFQSRRSNENWQAVVCLDFAGWLNKQLKGINSKFTPQPWHTKLWVELMEPQLRELNETLGFMQSYKKENV
jgi:CRISPR-associated protein Csy1